MLRHLKIKNYALISDIEVSFGEGLNIITGETGAGKSILVGALGLVLGNRADSTAVRNEGDKCIVEAEFEVAKYDIESYFITNDLDYDNTTIIRREITSAGKSRAFINDTPTTLKVLQALGSILIEIHSQRDNLQLFEQDFQFESLDTLAGCRENLVTYQQELGAYKRLQKRLDELQEQQANLNKEADFNQYLLDELEQVKLEEIDEESLIQEQELLENAEELIASFNEADNLLENGEYAITSQINDLIQLLNKSRTTVTERLNERLNSVLIELQDIAAEISQSADQIEINPERLEEVGEKVTLIHSLKNKHRVDTVNDLLGIKNELELKQSNTDQLEQEIANTTQKLDQYKKTLTQAAKDIHKKRKTFIPKLEEQFASQLVELGMQHSKVRYELLSTEELHKYGLDALELQLSSDKGNSYAPIKKSASGGELARINLSLKNLLASRMNMPSSIFDEIDTGVSGEIARRVGVVMANMARNQQVITITHLPQIASLGSHHLFVYKSENESTVETKVRVLKGEKRINEIAKMISGDNLTEHAVEQSKELLKG